MQLSRRRGSRMPVGSMSVANTSRFANPYRPARSGLSRAAAVDAYRRWLRARPELVAAVRRDLAGHHLACFCPLDDQPCHADVLLAVAAGAAP